MTIPLEITHLSEPLLQFGGEHEARTPKEGLAAAGPYDLRLGHAHRSQVRVALIGPPTAVAGMRTFLTRLDGNLRSERSNLALFPSFPGFEAPFRSTLASDPAWDVKFTQAALDRALARAPRDAFLDALELYTDGLRDLARRELRVDVALCCIPNDAGALPDCRGSTSRRADPCLATR